MNQLTKRQKELLIALCHESDFKPSSHYSDLLHISSKTLMRDAQCINELWCQKYQVEKLILTAKGKGCKLNEKYRQLLNEELLNKEDDSFVIPDIQKERVNWILNQISRYSLKNQAFLLMDLADSLYVSLATLKKDMKLVKRILVQSNLFIVKDKNNGLILQGDEKDIRKFIIERAFQKIPDKKTDKLYRGLSERMRLISRLILPVLQKYNIRITDLGLRNLVIHIEVLLQRIEVNAKISYIKKLTLKEKSSSEYMAASEIYQQLKERLQVSIPVEEIMNIYFHLISQKRMFSEQESKMAVFQNEEITRIVYDTLEEIKRLYQVSLQNDEILLHGLYMHLECALMRLQYNVEIHNELLDEILTEYPFEVQLATILSRKIENELGYCVNLEEIGYMALHFCGAMERLKKQKRSEQLNIVIVCGTSFATSLLLKEKLKTYFGQKLNVIKTVALYELKNIEEGYFEDIDLIISTVNGPINCSCKIIYISPIVSDAEIKKIETALYEKETKLELADLLKEKLFFKESLQSKSEVLDLFASKIRQYGLADEECIASVYERENLGSTEIGNLVAIPHSMAGKVYQSSILIVILNESIKWEHTNVQLIFLLLIDKEQGSYDKLFTKLFQCINNEYEIKKIMQESSFEYLKSRLL